MKQPALFFLHLALLGSLQAKDWPQFRGPDGDYAAREAKIITSFPASGPKVLWSIDVSEGYGGAAIAGAEVFFMDRIDQEKDVLTCASLADGKVQLRFEHAVPGRISHPGSRTVPTIRDDAVYAGSGFGHVYCVDRTSGERRWVLDVAKEFGAQPPRFGYAVSPIIFEELCIIAPTGGSVGVAAVSRKDGQTVWKSGSIGESHSSPVLVKLLGRDVIAMPGVRGGELIVMGLNPKDGEVLFEFKEEIGGGMFNPIPNLSMLNTDTAFYTGGYGKGTRILKFSEQEGKITVRKSGSLAAGATIHPPLVVGEQVYLTAGSGMGGGGRFGGGRFPGRDREGGRPPGGPGEGGRRGGGGGAAGDSGLMCLDESGKVLWATGRAPAFGGGCLINAGGVIISQDGDDGTLRLIEPGAVYKELASGKVFSKETGRELWAPMAFSDGKLVMRSQAQVVCVDLSAEAVKNE